MPLTAKGEKIKGAMEKKYGPKEGEKIFYASKNKGTITGVDMAKTDDNQHMGFTSGEATKVKELVSHCDALAKRMDAFEKRKQQPQPVKPAKPKTKDNMQPSNPHPKEPGG
jgi:hypothetical protein